MPFTRWNRNTTLCRFVVGTMIVGLIMSGTIWAQPMSMPNPQGPDGRKPEDQRADIPNKDTRRPGDPKSEAPRGGAPYPAIGKMFHDIPGGYDVVRMGPQEYIFYEGIFYIQDPLGFKVVAPPKGVVIGRLPVGFETLIVADITYFVFADVYYSRAPGGYIVVNAPPEMAVSQEMKTDEMGKALTVDVDLLNVRSGPGVDFPVASQVKRGDALTIQGTSGEWYYVALPDGSHGWVLSEFTRPMSSGAKG